MTHVSFKIFVFLTTLGGVPSLVENVSPTAIGRKIFLRKTTIGRNFFATLANLPLEAMRQNLQIYRLTNSLLNVVIFRSKGTFIALCNAQIRL